MKIEILRNSREHDKEGLLFAKGGCACAMFTAMVRLPSLMEWSGISPRTGGIASFTQPFSPLRSPLVVTFP